MPEWLVKFFDSVNIFRVIQKHFWSILFFICIFGWSVFLVPLGIFQLLQIENLRSTYIELIGAVTFVSTASSLFGLAYKVYKFLEGKLAEKRKAQEQQELLSRLTPTEYKYLLKYIELDSQTTTFTLFDGVVAGLVQKGILYKPDSQSNLSGEQDFNLYPWAYDYLHKNQHLANQGE